MSATPTLLRVKRRKNDDPSDVLVLSAKKRKTESGSTSSEDEGSIKILKLAATIDAKDDGLKLTETVNNILSKKNYPNFDELKLKYKKSISSNKVEKEVKETVKENRIESRYRLVAQKRALKIDDIEDWPSDEPETKSKKSETGSQEEKELFHLYDVVSEEVKSDIKEVKSEKEEEKISCNGVEMIREYVDAKNSEDEYGYVYDVYYTDALDGETAVSVAWFSKPKVESITVSLRKPHKIKGLYILGGIFATLVLDNTPNLFVLDLIYPIWCSQKLMPFFRQNTLFIYLFHQF